MPLASSRQPKKDSLQEEAKMQSSDDGKPPEQDAAEDDTMVAEMMKVDWKVDTIVDPLSGPGIGTFV